LVQPARERLEFQMREFQLMVPKWVGSASRTRNVNDGQAQKWRCNPMAALRDFEFSASAFLQALFSGRMAC
jgi:hypothetical protein